MKASSLIIAATVGILVAVLLWWRSDSAPQTNGAATDAVVRPEAAAGTTGTRRSPPPLDAGPADFRQRMRGFVDTASSLPGAERAARAEALREDILAREQSGELMPGESAYLQLALLRATVTDPARLQAMSQALLDEYQARSDAGWEAYRAQPDIRHQAYRAAEAELVRRMTEGAEPLSQDELRRRLQELREQYYREQ